ncbi:uncharacterized protein LOC126285367 [Schistocerca gregaria]|uniref:uncharacterized protein LOC126285367 n=1 Tax=Schistocerca gregaria TaxID=7010 RepID=UPI00211ED697|nr:uncharacterized protein LOC126285367 [Schistocerca gregaria]
MFQMSWGRPVTTEEAFRVLTVERQFLLEAADLLGRWRRSGADYTQLAEEMRRLQARHEQLLATAAAGLSEHSGITTDVTGALRVDPIPQKFDHPASKEGEAQPLPSGGVPGGTNDASDPTVEAGPTAEVLDLLRAEAPSAEDLHQLAGEFKRIWASHKLRFDQLDIDNDVSGEQ